MLSSIMAKESYKQHIKSEKVQVGCMSGLIRIFDFRRSTKFLSDVSHVRNDLKISEDYYGIAATNNDKDQGVNPIYAGRASIKALMEEEMASVTQPLRRTQPNISGVYSDDLKSVNLLKGSDIDLNLAASLMEIYRSHSEDLDSSNSVESGRICDWIDHENNTDAGANSNRVPSSVQKALEDVAEAVINHQSVNAKYITSSGEARTKEYVDALQLLGSNKELFLVLLQDPSSRLLQCLQNLYTSLGSSKLEPAEYDEETKLQGMSNSLEQSELSPSKMQRSRNSFLKEDKLVMRNQSKLNNSSRGLSRIVILKPCPARSQSSLISSSATSSPLSNHTHFQGLEGGDVSAYRFSLRELRRRLMLATMNTTTQKADSPIQFPAESMSTSSESTDSSDSGGAKKPSIDKETNPGDSENGMGNDTTHCVSSFSYEKAKKHLIERLDSPGDDSYQTLHKSVSIGRLISYPEYDTFSDNHCSQEEDTSLSHEATYSPLQMIELKYSSENSSPAMQLQETVSSDTSNLDNKQLDELRTDHGNHPFKEDSTFQELTDEEIKSMQDGVLNLPLSSEVENPSESLELATSCQFSAEEPQSMNDLPEKTLYPAEDLVSEKENSCPSTLVELAKPSILTIACSPKDAADEEEKLSPQSVLDSTSSSHETPKQDEFSLPSSRIPFKELDTPSASLTLLSTPQIAIFDDKHARISFIKSVLEASELLADESSERWYMDGSLLDTSVLVEVGTSYCLTDDVVLLFDCVEETLLKIRDNFFGVGPRVAFLKHNVRPAPLGTELIEEVGKCIDSLVSTESPNTLDQVVMQDLESGSWMDLRYDTESVVIEVWDGLLDDLLEEMVFDLWL